MTADGKISDPNLVKLRHITFLHKLDRTICMYVYFVFMLSSV